jgi:hypothetical protein
MLRRMIIRGFEEHQMFAHRRAPRFATPARRAHLAFAVRNARMAPGICLLRHDIVQAHRIPRP